MLFWIIALLLGLASAAILTRAALATGTGGGAPREGLQVYKDQLREVESDLARGVLTDEEADALRTEVSRRLLAAADAAEGGDRPGPPGASRAMAVAMALLVVGGGAGLYAAIGNPGARDMPLARRAAENAAEYAARPSQAEFREMLEKNGSAPQPVTPDDLSQSEMLERLKEILESRPDDLRGHVLLAENMARLGRWTEAAEAQARVVAIRGAEATATDHVAHGEYLILAVNGYVSPEAEAALRTALRKDPAEPRARYYSGLSALQAGRPDLAYDLWIRLLSEGPSGAPWIRAIRSQIDDVALAAGRPVPQRGPAASDFEAAAAMSPEERTEMIGGMVARLSDRLASEGGPAEDWARLIGAYGVLGERAQANRIWQEARQVFADAPADLALIRQAAREAEVVQ